MTCNNSCKKCPQPATDTDLIRVSADKKTVLIGIPGAPHCSLHVPIIDESGRMAMIQALRSAADLLAASAPTPPLPGQLSLPFVSE
jgi:hypothetical protein